jgi:hypothetical protein
VSVAKCVLTRQGQTQKAHLLTEMSFAFRHPTCWDRTPRRWMCPDISKQRSGLMFKNPNVQYFCTKPQKCRLWCMVSKTRTPQSTLSQLRKGKTLEEALHGTISFTVNVIYTCKKDASSIHFNISFLCVYFCTVSP